MPDGVRLAYVPCCGVVERGRSKLLLLGMPLLHVLTVCELRAVLAHEPELPVIELAPGVARTAILQLVAVLSLAHRSHVLEYGQQVHATLAHLLHRGGGLTSLCSRLARVSDCAVAVLGSDLHLLGFDPGPGNDLEPAAVTAAFRVVEPEVTAMAGAAGPHSAVTLELTVAGSPTTGTLWAVL